MEQITLGDIEHLLAWLVAIGGSVAVIIKALKKAFGALFEKQMTNIDERLKKHETTINKIDLENCKNFLVSYLVKVEHEGFTDEIETQRFWEEYEHYVTIGGNSYIKQKVDKLKKDGKL